jgi:hypothetical protein
MAEQKRKGQNRSKQIGQNIIEKDRTTHLNDKRKRAERTAQERTRQI